MILNYVFFVERLKVTRINSIRFLWTSQGFEEECIKFLLTQTTFLEVFSKNSHLLRKKTTSRNCLFNVTAIGRGLPSYSIPFALQAVVSDRYRLPSHILFSYNRIIIVVVSHHHWRTLIIFFLLHNMFTSFSVAKKWMLLQLPIPLPSITWH